MNERGPEAATECEKMKEKEGGSIETTKQRKGMSERVPEAANITFKQTLKRCSLLLLLLVVVITSFFLFF